MVQCISPGCKHRSDSRHWKKNTEKNGLTIAVTFHKFPKDENMRQVYCDILGIDVNRLVDASRVCSSHFSKECFYIKGKRTYLKTDALPSPPTNVGNGPRICSKPVQEERPITALPADFSQGTLSQPPIFVDKATQVSREFVYSSPEKKRLRQRINYLQEEHSKKLKIVNQTLRRQSSKLMKLQTVLDEIVNKRLISSEEAEEVGLLGTPIIEFLGRLHKKVNDEVVPKEYPPQLRSFAVTIHYYSPRAYEFVREQFSNVLPHPKTISAWYKSVNGDPGILSEAIDNIKEHVKLALPKILILAVIFDEIAIREHVELVGNKFLGYVDLGPNIACDEVPAKEALVFVVVCINDGWKIPVAYFLVRSSSAEQKKNLVVEVLKALDTTGAKVGSLTCDGPNTNFSVLKLLGCNLNDPQNLQTTFPHPVTGEEVVAFLDPAHMLKLVRNAFGALKTLRTPYFGEMATASWSHILSLHQLQENEGMHLGNKLRSAHIEYEKKKMNVPLAAQLFSKSVSDALLFCKNTLHKAEFEQCEDTAAFLNLINDLFDILNSRSIRERGFKKALCLDNFDMIIARLYDCKSFLLSVQNAEGKLMLETRKNTGFLGFLISIESALTLFHIQCVENKNLVYIPFYKISQDHAELTFGCIRHFGGGNNNPNARQLKSAITKIVVHTELRESRNGNCLPLEAIKVLHSSSAVGKPREKIAPEPDTSTTVSYPAGYGTVDNDLLDIQNEMGIEMNDSDDSPLESDDLEFTDFSDHVIEYIGGYVAFQLSKRLDCEACRLSLFESCIQQNNLIAAKSRGGLTQPSWGVVHICRCCENEIRYAVNASGSFISKAFNLEEITKTCLKKLKNQILFSTLEEHGNDQKLLEKHHDFLMETVARKYSEIRLHFITLQYVDRAKSKRQSYNKLVLFQGQ